MILSKREQRALVLWGVAIVAILLTWLVLRGDDTRVVAPVESVPKAAEDLARRRELAATVVSREQESKTATSELAGREKGLIRADTLPQAQAQLVQIVRRLTSAQTPPVAIRAVEVAQSGRLNGDYGEIAVPVALDCRIEQLLNLIADLTSQPELVAVRSLRISARDEKDKKISARIVFSGVVPATMIPEKRGPGFQ